MATVAPTVPCSLDLPGAFAPITPPPDSARFPKVPMSPESVPKEALHPQQPRTQQVCCPPAAGAYPATAGGAAGIPTPSMLGIASAGFPPSGLVHPQVHHRARPNATAAPQRPLPYPPQRQGAAPTAASAASARTAPRPPPLQRPRTADGQPSTSVPRTAPLPPRSPYFHPMLGVTQPAANTVNADPSAAATATSALPQQPQLVDARQVLPALAQNLAAHYAARSAAFVAQQEERCRNWAAEQRRRCADAVRAAVLVVAWHVRDRVARRRRREGRRFERGLRARGGGISMRGGVWGPVGDATASPKGKGGIRKRRKVQAQQKAADAEAKAQQQLAIRRIRKGEEVRRWVMALQRTPPLSPRHHEDSDVDGLDDAEHRDEKDKTPGGRGPETVTTAAVDATIWRRQLPETRDPEEMDYCTSESIIVPPKSSSSSNSNLQQGRVRQPTASNGMTTPTDDSKHEALRRRRERDAHLFAVADGLIRGSAVATTTATATSATAAGAGTSSGGSHPHPRIELPLLGPLSFDESDGSSSDESDSGDEDSVSFLDDALTSENTGDSDDNDDEESKVVQRSATGPKEDVSSEMSMS